MEKTARVIDRISSFFAIIAGLFIIFGVVLILIEVVLRGVFSKTLYITDEYTAYFMVAATFLGLAFTMKDKEHIRMTFLHKVIKGGKSRLALDIYTFLVGLAIFAVITVVTFNFAWDSFVTDSRSMQISRTYLAIPQMAMPLGSLLITLQFVSEIIKSIIKYRAGEVVENEDDLESQMLGR